MITRLYRWLLSSRHPAVVRFREFVRRHETLRVATRILVRVSPQLRAWSKRLRRWVWPPFEPQIQTSALLAARSIGGRISVLELDEIWRAKKSRVLCIAQPPELEQIKVLLGGTKVSLVMVDAADAEKI